jgi:hypothetical protein
MIEKVTFLAFTAPPHPNFDGLRAGEFFAFDDGIESPDVDRSALWVKITPKTAIRVWYRNGPEGLGYIYTPSLQTRVRPVRIPSVVVREQS